jgi:hypothetical protein
MHIYCAHVIGPEVIAGAISYALAGPGFSLHR